LERSRDKKQSIEAAFYVPLFNMLQQRQQSKTATEVIALENEKLVTFSPTFSRLINELLTPVLQRVYSLYKNNNKLPPLPDNIPSKFKVSYKSKIALALKNMQTSNFLQFMQVASMLAQTNPDVIDHIDGDKAFRGLAINFSIPAEFIRKSEEVDDIRETRQQQQQEQQLAEAVISNPEAAQNLSSLL
jgi:hypothetical protein